MQAYLAAHPELTRAKGGVPDFGAGAAKADEEEAVARSSNVPDWARGRTTGSGYTVTAAVPPPVASKPPAASGANPFSAYSAAPVPAPAPPQNRQVAPSFDEGPNPFASSGGF